MICQLNEKFENCKNSKKAYGGKNIKLGFFLKNNQCHQLSFPFYKKGFLSPVDIT